jgi:hypothetical protein
MKAMDGDQERSDESELGLSQSSYIPGDRADDSAEE